MDLEREFKTREREGEREEGEGERGKLEKTAYRMANVHRTREKKSKERRLNQRADFKALYSLERERKEAGIPPVIGPL